MTKLSTHIPLEVVKQNKKLQDIKVKKFYYTFNLDYPTWVIVDDIEHKSKDHLCPAPTIADILDNAEELFGETDISNYDEPPKYPKMYQPQKILIMCQQNKSIEEISEYITKNIK